MNEKRSFQKIRQTSTASLYSLAGQETCAELDLFDTLTQCFFFLVRLCLTCSQVEKNRRSVLTSTTPTSVSHILHHILPASGSFECGLLFIVVCCLSRHVFSAKGQPDSGLELFCFRKRRIHFDGSLNKPASKTFFSADLFLTLAEILMRFQA